jgi:methylthioribose-1-phosphate isomerase
MSVDTVRWTGGVDGYARLIDQTKLPGELVYLECRTDEEMVGAIKRLSVRGAPAIGVAAAMGLVLGVREAAPATEEGLLEALEASKARLAASRPTAVNLFWALERMAQKAEVLRGRGVAGMLEGLLAEAQTILEEDDALCRAIGSNGAHLIENGDGVLTHCNAGGLATSGYGTALAVVFSAHEGGRRFTVYADETRPLLQGARLTTWELMQAGIETVLICDDMAASAMQSGRVTKVVVGADRIAGNGDTANKIGTYGVAVLARHHGIPFYVAAPGSTFDLSLSDGGGIPIEERAAEEVTEPGGVRMAPEGVRVWSPAFDVTPAELITGIVTERGVIKHPNAKKVRAMMGER